MAEEECCPRRCGVTVTSGHERFTAVRLAPDEGRMLGGSSADAGLVVERVSLADGVPVELRRTVLAAGRVAVTAEFAVPDGYRLGCAAGP
ncbi:UTRA domain-containing protein [Pseudonocardia nigra]|uniref:UTRA domain-containing protein n=1 Tax=Pseudonocardia nigra TaxID=1921578 RepID=UPI001C607D3B|nr:UTRA domain-containing protein [Pseudonocardia nigra]